MQRTGTLSGRSALTLITLVITTVTGCATASRPTPRSPRSLRGETVDRDITGPSEARPPDPETTTEVTLAQLLAFAESHAPDLSVVRARTERGDAAVAAASPLVIENPELGGGFGGRLTGSRVSLELEVSLDQRFEIAGERRLRLEAAGLERDLAHSEEDSAVWQLHLRIHGLYLEALLAEDTLEIAERVATLTEELLTIANRLTESGERSPLTRLVAEAAAARARQDVIEARRRMQGLRLQLARAVGWPSGRDIHPVGPLPAMARAPSGDRLVELAREHNPLFVQRDLAVRAARARVRAEDREAWPEPSLGVAYGREGGEPQVDNVWLLTVGLPLPLWRRNQGGRAMARAELSIAESEGARLDVTLSTELARAVNDVNSAAERMSLYGDDILPTVEGNLRLIRRAYELGEVDIHQVSQLRERVLETQRQAVAAREAYISAFMALEALIGVELDTIIEGRTP